jgi:SAM-dependent methyltransferase
MKSRIPFEACPLCQSRAIKMLRTGDCSRHPVYHPIIPSMMNWLRCDACAHVFTDGYFPPDVLAILFQRTQEQQKLGWNFEQQRRISARMVENVARHVNVGAWLDVGFGNGSLLFTAEEWGFDPVGLDLRPHSVEAMRKLGLEAHCVDVTGFDSPKRFTVVSMADVLEHMPFPKDGLAAAHRLLAPDGILFVSMPNYDCTTWRLLDGANANPYWGELEHYHNFSRARLYALLYECGFEPLHYTISERYRACMEVIARRR